MGPRKIREPVIPDEPYANASGVESGLEELKKQCVIVTEKLILGLTPMSRPGRRQSLILGLMLVAYSVSTRLLCVGLYPYDQEILPPMATELSYCPTVCKGSSPSV